jgi:hypothetical protein
MERGYNTQGADEPMPNALIDLKSFMTRAVDFDSFNRPIQLRASSSDRPLQFSAAIDSTDLI